MSSSIFSRNLAKNINHLLGQPDIDDLEQQISSAEGTIDRIEQQHAALARVLAKIRASLDTDKLFKITARETCQLLDVERVAVYQFNEDWSGQFVSTFTTTEDDWDDVSPFGENMIWEDSYLQETKGGRYRANETSAIADIYKAGHAQCHIDLLEQYKVKAFAIAPIFNGMKLWGLLGIYQHSGPRDWQPREIDFLAQVGSHLGIAIQQSGLVSELEQKKNALENSITRQKALTEVVSRIRSSLDIEHILTTTCEEARHLIGVERIAVYRFNEDWSGEFIAHLGSCATEWDKVAPFGKNLLWEDTYLQASEGGQYRHGETTAVDDIYKAGYARCHVEILEQFKIRAYAAVPIFVGRKLWGLLGAYEHTAPRDWSEVDVDFLAQIGSQLGIAIQSAVLLSATQDRAKDFQKTSDQRQTLFDVVSKIRESLDIDTIFANLATGVRRSLKADRAGIYKFDPDSEFNTGEFIAEDVLSDFPAALNAKIEDHCFGENYANYYRKGRVYSVADVHKLDAQQCYLDLLEQFSIRSLLVAPILKDGELWGLLCVHQCAAPRKWTASDEQFLQQISDQLSIALKQSELLNKTKAQAAQLADAFKEVKQTQLQVVQSEKLAGLGQLVAGVAHEINNPVNFIHGNITHIKDYTQELLKLVDVYQQHCPDNPEVTDALEAAEIDYLKEDLAKILQSMRMGTERIREIVLSLRNFSRLDEAEFKAVNIHEGIDSTLMILAHRLKPSPDSPGILIEKDYADLPLVESYPGQLNQVFMNLLANAIDALEERDAKRSPEERKENPSTIRIWSERAGQDAVAFHIADNGDGIPEEIQSSLFDPFFTTKAVGKGTGLGLSISHQIITEKHQGKITCFSDNMQGTEFVIELPIKQKDAIAE